MNTYKPSPGGNPEPATFSVAGSTERQVAAQVKAAEALAEAIKGLGQVPAGHLYARVMGSMSLELFEGLIAILCRIGLVEREQSHLLRWVGPADGAPRSEGGAA